MDNIKVGGTCGTCARCRKETCRSRSADMAVCDCWEYCPRNHGKGPYGTKIEDYQHDLTPNTYGPITVESRAMWGDLKHPMRILKSCPVCGYLSAQLLVEVYLS